MYVCMSVRLYQKFSMHQPFRIFDNSKTATNISQDISKINLFLISKVKHDSRK